jgi:hypothetical protein
MDYMGQTAVLSAVFVLVGMVFLVPAITEKALAGVKAVAKGICGPIHANLLWSAATWIMDSGFLDQHNQEHLSSG